MPTKDAGLDAPLLALGLFKREQDKLAAAVAAALGKGYFGER